MRLWLVVLAALLAACLRSEEARPQLSTLLVVNSGAHVLAVFGEQGYLGRVHPGDEECFHLTASSGQTRLWVVVGRHRYYGPWFNATEHSGHWEWEIGMDPPTDVRTAMVPGEPCGRAVRR